MGRPTESKRSHMLRSITKPHRRCIDSPKSLIRRMRSRTRRNRRVAVQQADAAGNSRSRPSHTINSSPPRGSGEVVEPQPHRRLRSSRSAAVAAAMTG